MTTMNEEPLEYLKLVRASAGTGKTYALTGHYLELLKAKHDPETILATTFTRKAAGEIFGRVLTRLAEEAETETPHGTRSREILLDLCGRLHRVSISTLDSFFSADGKWVPAGTGPAGGADGGGRPEPDGAGAAAARHRGPGAGGGRTGTRRWARCWICWGG